MISREDLEKSDKILDMFFDILPKDLDVDFMESQHKFSKLNNKITNDFMDKKLSNNKKIQLTSAYKQFKNILEDILKENN